MTGLPSFEQAEAMCEMWRHPTGSDGWCACGEIHQSLSYDGPDYVGPEHDEPELVDEEWDEGEGR